ncbi:hypothetical protein VUR80DRAFT_3428 [Thermomyces stellatus]
MWGKVLDTASWTDVLPIGLRSQEMRWAQGALHLGFRGDTFIVTNLPSYEHRTPFHQLPASCQCQFSGPLPFDACNTLLIGLLCLAYHVVSRGWVTSVSACPNHEINEVTAYLSPSSSRPSKVNNVGDRHEPENNFLYVTTWFCIHQTSITI